MGIVFVACWAARTAELGAATITSTLSRTISAASSGSLEDAIRVASLDHRILALDVAESAETLPESLSARNIGLCGDRREISDPGGVHCRLRLAGARRNDQEEGEKRGAEIHGLPHEGEAAPSPTDLRASHAARVISRLSGRPGGRPSSHGGTVLDGHSELAGHAAAVAGLAAELPVLDDYPAA